MLLKSHKDEITDLLSSNMGDVWNVLTALRGPDHEESYDVKRSTTAVIRYALCIPPTNNFGCLSLKDDEEKVAVRVSLSTLESGSPYWTSEHFYRHVSDAFHALGLSWDTVNK